LRILEKGRRYLIFQYLRFDHYCSSHGAVMNAHLFTGFTNIPLEVSDFTQMQHQLMVTQPSTFAHGAL
jgi:hypothetical protein